MEQPATDCSTETRRLIESDFAHLWHPFTAMRRWRGGEPIVIEHGEGFELFDTEGRGYIDGFSSLWCNVHGHRVPEIDNAVRDQLGRIAHATMLGYATVPAIELAARIAGVSPVVEHENAKVFYSDAGATAVELALKMAIGHHYYNGRGERDTFVSLEGAYHGDTTGGVSVGYSEVLHKPFGSMRFRCAKAPAPDVARDRRRDSVDGWPSADGELRDAVRDQALAALECTLDEVGGRCAGVIIEPLMQGAAGMIEHPDGYLQGVERLARERGVLLIVDEVATGFARTGGMFACDVEGVRADIVCMGKGISGGYLPLAATVCSPEIARSFDGEPGEERTLFHGHTYTGNPLACAAGIASFDLIQQRGIVEHANTIGGLMEREIAGGLSDHPHVGDVRRRGVMIGIELVQGRQAWVAFERSARVGRSVCEAITRSGAMVRPLGDVLVLNPAPAMDKATCGRLIRLVVDGINSFDFDHAAR